MSIYAQQRLFSLGAATLFGFAALSSTFAAPVNRAAVRQDFARLKADMAQRKADIAKEQSDRRNFNINGLSKDLGNRVRDDINVASDTAKLQKDEGRTVRRKHPR